MQAGVWNLVSNDCSQVRSLILLSEIIFFPNICLRMEEFPFRVKLTLLLSNAGKKGQKQASWQEEAERTQTERSKKQ